MFESHKKFVNPQYLVETDWLEQHLDDPNLRILDSTVYLPNYFDESAEQKIEIVSGYEDYKKGHIPGSIFADQLGDLAGPDNPRYMAPMPSPGQFAKAMGRYGVGNEHRVIVYDNFFNGYATRLWWLFRVFGFDNVAVLSGGWKKWTMENRPVSTEIPSYPAATFNVHHRPHLIAQKEAVLAAIKDSDTCLINNLDMDEYAGLGPNRYGRRGHIPDSHNVSFISALNLEDSSFRSPHEVNQLYKEAGATDSGRVITYCGGAIAATSGAFLLTMLGRDDVTVYEGSMTEWAADESLPMQATA